MSTVSEQRNADCTEATELLLTSEDIKLVQEAKETFSFFLCYFHFFIKSIFLRRVACKIDGGELGGSNDSPCVAADCCHVSERACV